MALVRTFVCAKSANCMYVPSLMRVAGIRTTDGSTVSPPGSRRMTEPR